MPKPPDTTVTLGPPLSPHDPDGVYRRLTGEIVVPPGGLENARDWVHELLQPIAVPAGFVRESAHYVVDKTGTKMTFTLVDRKVFDPAPPNNPKN